MCRSKFTSVFFVSALTCLTYTSAVADMINDCSIPTFIDDAVVNTVVLSYHYAGRNIARERESAKLTSLVQQDLLFSQLNYNRNIAVVPMFHAGTDTSFSDDPCPPDALADQLSHKLTPGHALIFLWGNLFEDGDSIFIQNFIEIRRAPRNNDVTINWRSSGHDYVFSAGLPVSRIAFPAHEVPRSVIDELSAAYKKIVVVRDRPDLGSGFSPLNEDTNGDFTLSGYLAEVQGNWMHLSLDDRESVGWVSSSEMNREWPARKYLPELGFIEGTVGYLLLQVDRGRKNPFNGRRPSLQITNFVNLPTRSTRKTMLLRRLSQSRCERSSGCFAQVYLVGFLSFAKHPRKWSNLCHSVPRPAT